MLSNRTGSLFAAVFVGVLISTSHAGNAGNAMPILEISLGKRQYLVAEPLILRLVLTNKSSEKMPRYFLDDEHLAITDAFLAFSGSGHSGVFRTQFAGLSVQTVPLRSRIPPTIEPGDSWQCEKMVVPSYLDHFHRYTPLPAGHYRISAEVPLSASQPGVSVESSNALEVQIANPTGEEEKARALLGPNGMATFFLGEEGGKPKEIERLLTEYPQSIYARYAQARLILHRAEHLWDTRGSFSDSDRDESRDTIAEARAYIQRYPDMALNDNMLLWCARLQYMAGDKGESARTFQDLFTDYPQSEVTQTARKHVEDWKRSHKAFQNIRFPSPQTRPVASAPAPGPGGPALTTRPSRATGWIRVPTTASSEPASRPASEHPR